MSNEDPCENSNGEPGLEQLEEIENMDKKEPVKKWHCYCQPPNNIRTGPGLCPTCCRFPFLKTVEIGKRRPQDRKANR